MSDTASPNGLVPSRRWGSASNSTGTNMYNIASGYATSMFTGTLVEVSAGNLTILANGANSGAAPIGVFQGCQYTAANGTPTWSAYWPASTAVLSGSQAKGYVCDDPFATFIVQADTSVTAADIMTFNFPANIGTGSTITGQSDGSLDVAGRTVGVTALFRPIGYEEVPGNSAESAYPSLEVELIHHALRQGAVS